MSVQHNSRKLEPKDVGNMQKKIFKMNAAVIKRIEGIGGTCTVYAEIIFSFMIVCYMHFSVHDQ